MSTSARLLRASPRPLRTSTSTDPMHLSLCRPRLVLVRAMFGLCAKRHLVTRALLLGDHSPPPSIHRTALSALFRREFSRDMTVVLVSPVWKDGRKGWSETSVRTFKGPVRHSRRRASLQSRSSETRASHRRHGREQPEHLSVQLRVVSSHCTRSWLLTSDVVEFRRATEGQAVRGDSFTPLVGHMRLDADEIDCHVQGSTLGFIFRSLIFPPFCLRRVK